MNETLVRGPKGHSPAVETLVRDFGKPGRTNRGTRDQDFELSDSVQRLDPTRMSADFVYTRTREHDFEQPGRFYRALDQDLELSDSVQRLDPTRTSADFIYTRTREHDFEQPGRYNQRLDPTRAPADLVSARTRGTPSATETLVRAPLGHSPADQTPVREFEQPGRPNRRPDPTRMPASAVSDRTREHDSGQQRHYMRRREGASVR